MNNNRLSSFSRRGNALTFVLLLSAVMATLAFAATMLLPLSATGLDDHLECAAGQYAADGALEEALAHLNAGQSPEFSRDVSENGTRGSVNVRATGVGPIELNISSHMLSPRPRGANDKPVEWNVEIESAVASDAAGRWSVMEYRIVRTE